MPKPSICLIIEGCYPYVTGGVAAWIQRLLVTFSDEYVFDIVALTSGDKEEGDRKYVLPDNVRSFKSLNLFDFKPIRRAAAFPGTAEEARAIFDAVKPLLHHVTEREPDARERKVLHDLVTIHRESLFKHLLVSEEGFEFLTELYKTTYERYGFLKYYYNFRNIYLIFARCLTLYNELPDADLYHSPSAGFAGLLTCMKRLFDGKPTVITEHGIYVQERSIELAASEWLDELYLRRMWIEFFRIATLWEYRTIDRLVTLSYGNRLLEVEYGAADAKIEIIPNGIDLARYAPCRKPRLAAKPYKIGIVARVDPIKDVKTFIGAISIIKSVIPEIQAFVIGPIEDDYMTYYKECRDLVKMLGVEEILTFTGRADVTDYYKTLDVLLLTSVKEAMPLALMEAMASGIPVVATNVGACLELLSGSNRFFKTADDTGQAGYVATVMDSQDIALKTIRLLKNPEHANAMAQVGIRRIETYYREEQVTDHYRKLYREMLGGS